MILTHYAAGGVVATAALGFLFLVTAHLGAVTRDDVAAYRASLTRDDKLVFRFHDHEGAQLLPALFALSKTHRPLVVCRTASMAEAGHVVIRISNRFGKTMQGVLNVTEWIVGLFYPVHFPTTIEAIASEVHAPGFGQQLFGMMPTLEEIVHMRRTMLRKKECRNDVLRHLKQNELVCAANLYLRSPDGNQLYAVGIFKKGCITLVGTEPRLPSSDDLGPFSNGGILENDIPLLTKIKFALGMLVVVSDR